MARVVHFDITAPDFDAPIAVYRTAFGWKIDVWDGPVEYWLIATGELTIGVESLDATLGPAKKRGATITQE